eukprot:633803-Pelagomonas_calceolata.AAC.2
MRLTQNAHALATAESGARERLGWQHLSANHSSSPMVHHISNKSITTIAYKLGPGCAVHSEYRQEAWLSLVLRQISLSKALPVAKEQPSEGEEGEDKDRQDEEREEEGSPMSETGAALAQKLQEQLVRTSAWAWNGAGVG